jgi:anti-sigma B factor antagonist
MPELARVEIDRRGDVAIAIIHGEVDIGNVHDVETAITDAIDHGETRHVIDLSPTTFLDSAAIRLLFTLATMFRTRRQQLHIVVPDGSPVAKVLTLTAVQEVIPIFGTLDGALSAPVDDLAL